MFDTPPSEMRYAEIAVNVPLDRTFHYRIPDGMRGRLHIGARVLIPFGPRSLSGYCVGFSDTSFVPPNRIKPIHRLLDTEPLLDPGMIELTRWIADEYVCGWGEALQAALPAGVRKKSAPKTVLMLSRNGTPEELLAAADQLGDRARRQAALLRRLAEAEDELTLSELADETGATAQVATSLAKKGYVTLRREQLSSDALAGMYAHHSHPLPPNADQRAALDALAALLQSPDPGVALLHGVTGSGKTEVYLQALQSVVNDGKQGIVLVPEIALTPQTVRRFASRFARIAVLHSRLTEAERRDQWHRIRSGEARVVVGARSAIFAPMKELGLIVIDEPHEGTFKQQSAPRYHAVEVAIERGRREGALVLLGTATPSLEDYHRARKGDYAYLLLPKRIGDAPLPRVELVNMVQERADQKRYCLLSKRLVAAVNVSLSRGEQVILFLNRRGFATYVTCKRCGHVVKCPQCDVSMVFHRKSGDTKCHTCGAARKAPGMCPVCHSEAMRYLGAGTQRIEDEIASAFPEVTCARMDSDSTTGRTSHRDILADFHDGKTQILLGTQMIAKGLDFPNVTLVGVISADITLNMPDFRSAERTFQLLAQVAGRTGRGHRGGRVIIQTSQPDQACIQFAARHDYAGFSENELAHRKVLSYPPFGRLARILVEARDAKKCDATAGSIATALRKHVKDRKVQILGPTVAPLALIRGRHRHHIVLKEKQPGDLHALLAAARSALRASGSVQVTVDIDPVGLL